MADQGDCENNTLADIDVHSITSSQSFTTRSSDQQMSSIFIEFDNPADILDQFEYDMERESCEMDSPPIPTHNIREHISDR